MGDDELTRRLRKQQGTTAPKVNSQKLIEYARFRGFEPVKQLKLICEEITAFLDDPELGVCADTARLPDRPKAPIARCCSHRTIWRGFLATASWPDSQPRVPFSDGAGKVRNDFTGYLMLGINPSAKTIRHLIAGHSPRRNAGIWCGCRHQRFRCRSRNDVTTFRLTRGCRPGNREKR